MNKKGKKRHVSLKKKKNVGPIRQCEKRKDTREREKEREKVKPIGTHLSKNV